MCGLMLDITFTYVTPLVLNVNSPPPPRPPRPFNHSCTALILLSIAEEERLLTVLEEVSRFNYVLIRVSIKGSTRDSRFQGMRFRRQWQMEISMP